jgi:malate permease and related proteins
MTETLFHAYTPLILWMGLGLIAFRFVPQWFPRFLGRCLYWVGVPLELLVLARQSNQNQLQGAVTFPLMASIITIIALVIGLIVASAVLWGWEKSIFYKSRSNLNSHKKEVAMAYPISLPPTLGSSSQGSFIISAVLGNTGFVGLALAPSIVNADALNWAVVYSITHNVVGPYGFGVLIASYFSHNKTKNRWWMQLRDILTVPPLWGFMIGIITQKVQLPVLIESGLQSSVQIVIACAFLLTGIRLAQLQGWKCLKLAVAPAVIKIIVIPLLVGLMATLFLGLSGDQRLAMVLMSGMPSAFAGLILAEEYNLDRDLIASSILLSTLMLLVALPLWIMVFD